MSDQQSAVSPGPSADLGKAVREISGVLRRDAEEAEQLSRLTPDMAHALRDAGLFRAAVPRALGGLELPATAALEVTADIALADPSSAWVVMVSYVAQQIAGSFGEAARADLWGKSPDAPMCGVFSGVGASAEAVEGGLLVSGRWSWASGCHHAEWALVGVPVPGPPGGQADRALALVPAGDLTIEETWDMAGMRATGSDTLVGEGVFVPHHRLRRFSDVMTGRDTGHEPLYRIAPGSLTLTSVGPLLGSARAIFRTTMEAVDGGKPMAMSLHSRLADSPSVQAELADAATLIDSAHLHLERSARLVDTAAAADTPLDLLDRARVRMDVGHASTCLRQAVQFLLSVSGASSFARTRSIQRHWRDLETAARHPSINPGLAREMYGRALVGDERPVTPMV